MHYNQILNQEYNIMACGCKKSSGQVSKMKQVVKKTHSTTIKTENISQSPTRRIMKRLSLKRPI